MPGRKRPARRQLSEWCARRRFSTVGFGRLLRELRVHVPIRRDRLSGRRVVAHGLAHRGLVARAGELAVLGEDRHELAVDAGRGRQALALLQEVGLAREIAHQAAGLGHQQRAGRHVPDGQARLEETFGEAGRHVGEVQRGRAGAAQAGRALHHVGHDVQVGLEVVARAEREAGGQQAFLELGALGHADAPLVQVGAAALGGREQVVARRVVDDGLLDLAAHHERDAHAIDGKAVDEVGGAVQRVDDPDEFRILRAVLAARFLGEDAMARIGGEQGLDDGLLARVVHLGHEVVDLLLRNAHRLDVERRAVDDGACGASGLDGHVEHGVQIGRHEL